VSSTEEQLVQTCQAAKGADFEEAFSGLYVLYKDRVYSICFRVCGHQDDALDAAQETMVTLAHRIGDFQFRSRFSSWVFRIAVNASIDVRRRRLDAPRGKVRTQIGTADEEGLAIFPQTEDQGLGPVETVQRTESMEAVRQALASINPKFSSLLVLRYLQDLSYEEISETLECSLGTVKSRLNRAHGALREYMSHRGGQSHFPT